ATNSARRRSAKRRSRASVHHDRAGLPDRLHLSDGALRRLRTMTPAASAGVLVSGPARRLRMLYALRKPPRGRRPPVPSQGRTIMPKADCNDTLAQAPCACCEEPGSPHAQATSRRRFLEATAALIAGAAALPMLAA